MLKAPNVDGVGTSFASTAMAWPMSTRTNVLMIDGNRDGRYVLFDHDSIIADVLGSRELDTSCVLCHHMNKPFDQGTRCYECHTDMYLSVDIFDHDFHMAEVGRQCRLQRVPSGPTINSR